MSLTKPARRAHPPPRRVQETSLSSHQHFDGKLSFYKRGLPQKQFIVFNRTMLSQLSPRKVVKS
jgi:hypothetical protein